jgi:hypothetical protein
MLEIMSHLKAYILYKILECDKPACAVCKDRRHKNAKKRPLQSAGVYHVAS